MQRIILFLLLALSLNITANTKKIKIACVGNSVTYGATLPDRETNAYPFQLQRLLGDAYEVSNFGVSGSTLLSKGHIPYIQQEAYWNALDLKADYVVIHLGLNDTDPRNWVNYRDEFFSDYVNLINDFRRANPKVKIWICRMSTITHEHHRFRAGTRDWYREIQKEIERVAHYANVWLIDLEKDLHPRPDLLPDALHPNVEGAGIIAKTVYSALTGNYGDLHMPIVYSDNMVLQRDRPIHITGTANAGDVVTVEIAKQKSEATTGGNGVWEVTLNPMSASTSETLTIGTKDKTLEYTNVGIGEVWLCSGQSNMAFKLYQSATAKETRVDNPNLRLFNMTPRWEPHGAEWESDALASVNHLDYYKLAKWENCAEDNALDFSAIAYYFGQMMSDSLQIPIGLIQNSVGGSGTESWVDRYTMELDFPDILMHWRKNEFIQNWVRARADQNAPISDNRLQRHPYEPCYLFEAGIDPLNQFPIRGVVWYQGESNAHNIETHERLFRLLTESWRKNWKDEKLPIHYVQLSSLNRPSWTYFRDSQRRLMYEIDNVHMVVSSDKGDVWDVHPTEKKEIGERLAYSALHHTYHKKNTVPSGPLFRNVTFDGDKAYVYFDYSEGMHGANSEELRTFEIAGIDEIYFPAKAVVEGDKVKVWSNAVKAPKYVRYGWQPFTEANLVNGSGLPASTFQSKKKDDMNTNIEWKSLPNYPIKGGVSAPFVGVSEDRLIVAGGCNFKGDVKTFYKDVYSLDISEKGDATQWEKHDDLDYELAYGAYVPTPKGIVCIGGMNQDSVLTRVTLLNYDSKKQTVNPSNLPSLPLAIGNGSANLLDNTIYLTGGNTKKLFCLDLNNLEEGWIQMGITLSEERQQPILVAQNGKLIIVGGYDEANAGVSTDILGLNLNDKQWDKLTHLPFDTEDKPIAMVGATGLAYQQNEIIFAGGVNYDRFYSALQRIKKTKQAELDGDKASFDALKEKGKKYLSQKIDWYKFRTSLLKYDVASNKWSSLGNYQQLARAGAGVTLHNNKLYIICGELKPAVRTDEVNCAILK